MQFSTEPTCSYCALVTVSYTFTFESSIHKCVYGTNVFLIIFSFQSKVRTRTTVFWTLKVNLL